MTTKPKVPARKWEAMNLIEPKMFRELRAALKRLGLGDLSLSAAGRYVIRDWLRMQEHNDEAEIDADES